MSVARPLALTEGFAAEEVDGGLLIYDEHGELVLKLNRSAALVWQKSDGTRTVSDLVDVLTEELGVQADEDQVLVALDELSSHGLIESGYDQRDANATRLSRRHFIRRVGIVAGAAAVGIPIVHSMAVPKPAEGSTMKRYTYCGQKHKFPYTDNCGPKKPHS